jgi:hypothetical protein
MSWKKIGKQEVRDPTFLFLGGGLRAYRAAGLPVHVGPVLALLLQEVLGST